ncbi:MAG: DUF1622 domain-containing protein [Saprospiraceae bacterium]|nr:DUF1622 domain-containing protein [Pyrinomonadaceae bacterium]
METIKQLIEWSATGIELLGVLIIVLATAFGTVQFIYHLATQVDGSFKKFKVHMGKMLILILEFLVASDIIRTIVIDQTIQSVAILGLLVLIRTFLSWSLTVEVEGRWPWSKEEPRLEETAQ